MADAPGKTETEAHVVKVASIVAHYTTVTAKTAVTGAKGKPKPKTKKENKTKEFSHTFEPTQENYLALLKTILAKHGEEQYNITARMTYSFKVQLPQTKKAEALDIDKFDKYKDFAKNVVETSPSKLTVFADMADVEKRWSRKRGQDDDSDDEDMNGEDAGLNDSNGLSELDRALARFRGILEKEHQNDHDSGYTYIDPKTAKSYPLSPQMMKEWCRAMHDGTADKHNPPAHLGLNTTDGPRQPALHPSRIAAGVNQPQAVGSTSDLGHLANIMTMIMGPRAAPTDPAAIVNLHTPPKKGSAPLSVHSPVLSPLKPTPTKLPRFLEYAETSLGIPTARTLESPMRRNGFGPDIMHMLEDKELIDLGMNKGDAIRLKAGAQTWWNGPNAKRKRDEETASGHAPFGFGSVGTGAFAANNDLTTPPSKKVSFETRFSDGGAERFYGPRMTPSDSSSTNEVFYKCPTQDTWRRVPTGYRAVHEQEATDDDLPMDFTQTPFCDHIVAGSYMKGL
ncbi:hypothetical protein DFH06DRAFT_1437490 [Mycena polygramma]|nr:hypothetical protein DFH06DRAFT_1437490 [Mycena polygramma]